MQRAGNMGGQQQQGYSGGFDNNPMAIQKRNQETEETFML